MIGKMIPFAISFGGKYNTEDQHHMNEEVDMLKDFRFICCTLKEGSRRTEISTPRQGVAKETFGNQSIIITKDNQPVILPVSTKMEKRIILEKRGRTDDQITELILDNCRSTYIDGLTDNFTALETLSLINVGLVSLKNFPKLINLKKLELSDNRISNSLSHLTGSPKLTHLNLSGNRIKDFDELKPLQNLGNLEVLDLFNNQVTLVENYRDKIFQLLPSLKYLDGFDKDFAEAPSDEEEIVDDVVPSRFSINGIEIDLDELEELESRIQQKRCIEKMTISNAIDGLECTMLQLDIANSTISSSKTSEDGGEFDKDDIDELYEEIQRKQAIIRDEEEQHRRMPSFFSILMMFVTLLAFINQVYFQNIPPTHEKDAINPGFIEEEDTCEESDDVSLAYLYNDDLEEDQEDWKSVEGEDDDSDSDDEDGIENCEAEETSSDGPGEKDEDSEGNDDDSEEVPADGADLGTGENPLPADTLDSRTKAVVSDVRGKKRKLDGTDSDG
ncbi:acidic leucine-rich nuclear phosphoprotein 32 family member A isoform X2 [Anopheles aquasalis]|uniref:acidic leucine-rich nuclear phosphoprotein 32 family member A isoform X2 n=1 Tax=Anopheles aquasalis TaxID=42839 RepID=UPI00215B4328|nr:acidic leucine-rich nuclear phosphoprotein 32 family member A isoform X2 [Anopheles aquasalis]